MKRFLVIGLVVTTLGLLIASFVTPLFAQGPDDGQANEEAWEAMHKACESGDWEAMAQAAEVVHGEDFGHMDDGMMGGGMMGNWN